MTENNEFLQIPYEERKLILVVKDEEEKKAQLLALESDAYMREKLLSSLALAQLFSLGLPVGILSIATRGEFLGKYINTMKRPKGGGHLYIATMTEVSSVKFPTIMPNTNMVYVVNPASGDSYYEVPNFHNEIAKHKFAEAIHLLQSLGATRIEAINIEKQGTSGKGGISFADFAESNLNFEKNNSSKNSFFASYKPTHQPKLPENLSWYNIEKEWQNIADGRLNRGMKSFHLEFEISSDFGINGDLITKLDKAFNLKLNAGFNNFKNTHLRITVEFDPII